jgi:hypothetical protein
MNQHDIQKQTTIWQSHEGKDCGLDIEPEVEVCDYQKPTE